jgi:cell wall-associated NlpC family hydrolase
LRPPTDAARFLALALLPAALAAQRREMEIHYGRWLSGNHSASYEFRTSEPLFGETLTHGFGATVLIHDSLGRHRAFYGLGWEVQAYRHRAALAPYALLGVELGLSTDTAHQEVAALWSLGGGVEWRPVAAFAIGAEGRYRIEDRGPRGFWSPGDAHTGFGFSVGMSLALGGAGGGGGAVARRPAPGPAYPAATPPLEKVTLPPPTAPATVAGVAGDVVRTALDAIGTPYQWGGTAANGFDCSGLIQYAYGQHGIRLPRMSRDQAKAGNEVPPVPEALQPGDILLFAVRPGGGISHVGMYVGEGKFIHSSNSGVRLSYLDPHDPEAGYWLPRWVGVRRVLVGGGGT